MSEPGLRCVNRLVTVSLLMLTVSVGQPAFSEVRTSQVSVNASQAAGENSTPDHMQRQVTAEGLQILKLGRQIYSDLQLARRAALNRQADSLRFALQQVRKELAQLNLPPAMAALKAQALIITNNLADTTGPVDADLWVPINTELEAVSLYLPPQTRAQARAAVSAGRAAVRKGDRAVAGTQLDLLVSFLHYETGAFPLQRVRADIQSAWSSASLPQPYWKGVLEAVQSALGEIHWVTGANAGPLLTAYQDAVNAYVLWPQHKQAAIDYLARVQEVSATLPGGAALAGDAHRLMEKNNLGAVDLKQFIARIGRRIDRERVVARDKLLERLNEIKTP